MFPALLLVAAPAIVFQQHGRLLTSNDEPAEGAHTLVVSLYNAPVGGVATWTDTFEIRTDKAGLYAVTLGDTENAHKPITSADLGPEAKWLGVKVDATAEFTPRLHLGAVPLAGRATVADAVIGTVDVAGALKQNGADLISADGHFLGPTDNLDVTKIGGIEASRTPTAGKLLPLGEGGVFPDAVIPSFDGGKKWVDVTEAIASATGSIGDASRLTTGTVADARLPANLARLVEGKLPDAALPASVALLGGTNTFAGANTFTGATTFNPATGNVPFSVPSGANGVVANLNAGLLGGHPAGDFLLAATYKPPQAGAERLVLNFDEGAGAGTDVTDSSGAGNNGTFVASTLTRTTAGHNASGALTFAAGGGLVTVPDTGALSITNNLTIEAWVYPTAYPAANAESVIVMKERAYGMRISPAGRVQVAVQTAVSGTWDWFGGSTPLPLNTWSHVAATYNGVELIIFVNGVNGAATAYPNGPIAVNTNPLTVGARSTSNVSSFIGTIDEVRVAAVAKPFRAYPHQNIVWSTGSSQTDAFASTNSAWAAMPDLDTNPLSITTTGGPLRFGFRGNFDCDGTSCSYYLKITVDGAACGNVTESQGFGRIHDASNSDIYDMQHVEGICAVAPGTHTVKAWYASVSNAGYTTLRHHGDMGRFLLWAEEL